MRSLDPEERALWARVAETIRPLSRAQNDPQRSPVATVVRSVRPATTRAHSKPAASGGAIGATLDAGWDRRLSRGSVAPDRVLDLHGHTLDSAWRAIDEGLERAIGRGERLVLLITGHARSGDPPLPRGKIRAAVNDWLAASRHASKIAAIRPAHRTHGGGGSLYIVLRRR